MKYLLQNPRDLWAGLFYVLFGSLIVWLGSDYGAGTARQMGPGYFPRAMGAILIVIGLCAMVRCVQRTGAALERLALRKAGIILGSLLLFAILLEPAGLVPSLMLLIVTAAFASPQFNWKTALLLASALTLFSVVVFVFGLGMPMSLFGSLSVA